MEPEGSITVAWRRALGSVGALGVVFAAAVALSFARESTLALVARVVALITGVWLCGRWLRSLTRKAIWRLRNRLLVTYLFIAVVPLILIITLVAFGTYAAANQVVVHLMKTELDRRVELISSTADRLKFLPPDQRRYNVEHMLDMMYKDRFQGIQVIVRDNGTMARYPDDESLLPPPAGWSDVSGILQYKGMFYGWAHRVTPTGDITVRAPFTRKYLAGLQPDLGIADIYLLANGKGDEDTLRPNGAAVKVSHDDNSPATPLKAAVNQLDIPVTWLSLMPFYRWEEPGTGAEPAKSDVAVLSVQSRPSMILDVLFTKTESYIPYFLGLIAISFLIVEIIALVMGVSMTATITGAVHTLYEGTQRVMEGDFTHRINLKGRDQLAELGSSFNRMTENVEQLLAISKEKERMQSELEIASEVQNQLYPKAPPDLKRLRLRALVKPARMVSGDYYDFDTLSPTRIAIAIGDVAGKGISAALLMATLQSSVRTRMSFARDNHSNVSSSALVSGLNVQLYETTSPEKYCTFFLGLFDTDTCEFTYTNAGHLPPMLFRGQTVDLLEVDGMVVGAFPQAEYGESKLAMKPGDLLLFYTDGITEPENEYGEMFGEARVMDVVKRNQHRSEAEILQAIVDGVLAWTGAGELQDDMTLVLARCSA